MLLPSGFKVQRSVEMAATPDRIYPLIADPREWKRWSVWNRRDPAMTDAVLRALPMNRASLERGRARAKATARWSSRPPCRTSASTTRSGFPDMGMRSSGQLRLEATGAGTRVTWTNEGDMGCEPGQPLFRPVHGPPGWSRLRGRAEEPRGAGRRLSRSSRCPAHRAPAHRRGEPRLARPGRPSER